MGKIAVLLKENRKKAEDLTKKIRYLELGTVPTFEQELMKAMYLPNQDLLRFPSVKTSLKLNKHTKKEMASLVLRASHFSENGSMTSNLRKIDSY
jgi:uncharacterized 2Fe-2S/4Fe-4S cluster protein (DUF4445 family)